VDRFGELLVVAREEGFGIGVALVAVLQAFHFVEGSRVELRSGAEGRYHLMVVDRYLLAMEVETSSEQSHEGRVGVGQQSPELFGFAMRFDEALPQSHHFLPKLSLALEAQMIQVDLDIGKGILAVENDPPTLDIQELDGEDVERLGDELG
jgi:hypothetical protein